MVAGKRNEFESLMLRLGRADWKRAGDSVSPLSYSTGSRSAQTLKKMLDRLSSLEVKVFFADNWEAYAELIPVELLVQTKAQTHGVERNNFRQRHWCGRFRRKTCMVSRSLVMIDLTVFLFARFHVNGSREELWNSVHNPF